MPDHEGHSGHTPDGACVYSPEDIAAHVVAEKDGFNNVDMPEGPIIAYAVVAIHERAEDEPKSAIPSVSVLAHKPASPAAGMVLAFGQLTLTANEMEKLDAAEEMAEVLKRHLFGDPGDMDIPANQEM